MTNHEYNLWTLTELRKDDPREYLDIIIVNAKFDKVQAIQYQDDTVFVISKVQYEKLKSIWVRYKDSFYNGKSLYKKFKSLHN